MQLTSKKTSLLILGVTAILGSRAMFFFFNDPEGPNLLIVTVAAVVIYFLSLTAYLFKNLSGIKKLLLAIVFQTLLVSISYFCLK